MSDNSRLTAQIFKVSNVDTEPHYARKGFYWYSFEPGCAPSHPDGPYVSKKATLAAIRKYVLGITEISVRGFEVKIT